LQTVGEILHARRIEIAALALHDEHQRNDGRALDRIPRNVLVDLRFNFRRERSRLRHVHRMIWRLNLDENLTHRYRSISPKTISSDPIIATTSAIISPCAMWGSADRFTKLGPRKCTRAGFGPPVDFT